MTFSEKLYTLRKSKGLSQEQLAEKLNVSRQAVSKWESAAAIPETEKLIAISDFFGVSLDYLIKDTSLQEATSTQSSSKKQSMLPGLVLSIGGVACLIFGGLIAIFSPSVGDNLAQSSAIHIDGNGMLQIGCVAAIITGTALLLKDRK